MFVSEQDIPVVIITTAVQNKDVSGFTKSLNKEECSTLVLPEKFHMHTHAHTQFLIFFSLNLHNSLVFIERILKSSVVV